MHPTSKALQNAIFLNTVHQHYNHPDMNKHMSATPSPMSVSDIIEKGTTISEFPEDRPPLTDDEVLAELNLNHLAPNIQDKVRAIFT